MITYDIAYTRPSAEKVFTSQIRCRYTRSRASSFCRLSYLKRSCHTASWIVTRICRIVRNTVSPTFSHSGVSDVGSVRTRAITGLVRSHPENSRRRARLKSYMKYQRSTQTPCLCSQIKLVGSIIIESSPSAISLSSSYSSS